MKKFIVLTFTVMILSYTSKTCIGQIVIKGNIIDSLSLPVPFAQAILKDETNSSIIGFAQANNTGFITINVKKTGKYMLMVSSISYKTELLPVEIGDSIHEISLRIVLEQKAFEIKEVVFQSDRPINVKGDTIIYKAISFKRGDERVVEDVLKRIPGIEIEQNGKISYNGKEVDRLMIEGDDLFGKSYQIISKNLHANVIDKVEIYKHYLENSLLKEIEESDKVAINLRLSENPKFNVYGNTTLGYSFNKHHEFRTTLMSLRKKNKHYFFSNFNNLGYDPVGDVSQFLNPKTVDDNSNNFDIVNPEFSISLNEYYPNINEQRFRVNNSKMGSYCYTFDPTKKLKMKIITFYNLQDDFFYRRGYQAFITEDPVLIISEELSSNNYSKNGFVKLETKYMPNEKLLVEFRGHYNNNKRNSYSYLFDNSKKINEHLHNNAINTNHSVTITKRLRGLNLLLFMSQFNYDYRPENYKVDTFLFSSLFQEFNDIKAVSQKVYKEMYSGMALIKLINKITSKTLLDSRLGVYYNLSKFSTDIYLSDSLNTFKANNPVFLNDLSLGVKDFYAGTKLLFNIGNIKFNCMINAHKLRSSTTNISINDKKDFDYIEPSTGINIRINKKQSIQTSYTFNASITSMNDLANGLVVRNYRMLQGGASNIALLKGHNLFFMYMLGSPLEKIFFNTSIIYNKNIDFLTSNTRIAPEYVISNKILGKNKDLLMFSSSSDFYIKPLMSNLKLKIYASDLNYDYYIDNKSTNISSLNMSWGIEFRSAFRGLFNFHLGSSWSNNKMIGKFEQKSQSNNQFLDFYLNISSKIKIQLKGERYYFNNEKESVKPLYFVDASIKYDIVPNKFNISFDANNILNYTEYKQFSISDIDISSIQYRLIPRFFFLRINYSL